MCPSKFTVLPVSFTFVERRGNNSNSKCEPAVPFGMLWSVAPDKDTVEEAEEMVQSMDGQFVQSLCCMGKSLHCELARPSQAAHVATTTKAAPPNKSGPSAPPAGPPVPPKAPPPGFRTPFRV